MNGSNQLILSALYPTEYQGESFQKSVAYTRFMLIFRYMKNQLTPAMKHTENQQVTISPAYDTTYFSAEAGGFITTRKERKKMQSRTNANTAKRSSRPVKQQQSTPDVAMHFAAKDMEKDFARVFHFGKKSDFIASAEPQDRSKTVVLINGIPHKKDGQGKYKALTFKSSTEALCTSSTFETEMYQYLFLLAENGPTAADFFADLVVASTEK